MPRSSAGWTPTDAQTRASSKKCCTPPGRGLPAHVLHLARLRAPALDVRLGRVVVMTGLGGPRGVDARVERPVRKVDAAHGVGQRLLLQRGGREPELAVPRPDRVAGGRFGNPERQHALGAERRLGLSYGTSCAEPQNSQFCACRAGISTEIALQLLALDLTLLHLPAAQVVADAAQRGREIVLDDRPSSAEPRRRLGAAERADELLLRGIPGRLATAGGTGELRQRDRLGHRSGLPRVSASA